MNSTIAKLADEFEKMEKTIASQKKMIETLMPTGYVDTDTVKLHLNSVYGVMFGGRPSPKRCKLEDCSWDEINMYSSFGLADKMFEVGDTKKFRLADGSYLTARIIGFNHDYLTTPQKDYAVITQSIGRIARTFEGKGEPIAYDYVDDGIQYLVRSYKKRCTTYRKAGCKFLEP